MQGRLSRVEGTHNAVYCQLELSSLFLAACQFANGKDNPEL